ncbi:MAG TPA: hypothetical protein VJQ51_10385, partial [Burkholderiales bacterium]|nr:hypothetical protein [Burkholderiales bacterium]
MQMSTCVARLTDLLLDLGLRIFIQHLINKYFKNPLLPQLCYSPGDYASPVPQGKSHKTASSWLLAALFLIAAIAH